MSTPANLETRITDAMYAEAIARAEAAEAKLANATRTFIVRNNGEYGTFFLREGMDGEADRTCYWCQLTCNTSFGVVGYHWGSMGSPAAQFLPRINNDYLLGKLWGMNDRVFDAGTTLKAIKQHIIESRRNGSLDADEARERWDHLPESLEDEHELRRLADDCDWLWQGLADGDYGRQMVNPQAAGFAEHLWPAFIAQLTGKVEA